jgi:hypothetical protein
MSMATVLALTTLTATVTIDDPPIKADDLRICAYDEAPGRGTRGTPVERGLVTAAPESRD